MPQTDRQPYVDLYINDTRITTSNYLTNFVVRKSIGGWEGTIELYDPTWTTIEALSLEKGVGTEIKFTYGWMGEQSNIVVARMGNYQLEFSQDGVRVSLEWAFGSLMSARIKRNVNWSEKMRISDIVSKIASNNGWDSDIEPTKGLFSHPIIQDNVSDFYFIKNVLAPRAVNSANVGGYKAHFESNKLTFRSIQTKDTNIYKTYKVYRDMDGEVISFAPSENVADIAQFGGRRVKIKSFDPLNKKVIEADTSYQDTTTSLDRDGRKVSSVEMDKDSGEPLKVISKSFPKKSELNNYARAKYAEFSQYNYSAEAELLGDPFIPIMGNLQFAIMTPSGLLHYLSGVYKVFEVEDTVTNGEFVSAVTMARRAVVAGSEEIKGIDQNLVSVPVLTGSVYREAG
jgi:hypothetical protein